MSTPVRTTPKPVAKAPAKRPDDLKATVSPAAKLRRRPLLIVLSTFLVAVGALVGAWAWISTTASSEVVVVRVDVARGQRIEAAHLGTARVTVDPSVATVPAGRMSELVGLRATSDLTAGSLVNPGQTGPDVIPPVGMTIVGVPVEFGMLPAERCGRGTGFASCRRQDCKVMSRRTWHRSRWRRLWLASKSVRASRWWT